jgi:hypothetical protein
MVMISATQQNLSSEILEETVQQANHYFSLPTGPAIKPGKSATKNVLIPKVWLA